MGRLMRAKDWRGSGLGMPASWPASTKTAVSICLNSLFPMILWLGPELRIVYNDAYIPFLGHAKHPRVLGLPGKDAWSEIWSSIAPLHARVYAGQAVSVEDSVFFFNRHCTREEVYVTFSYSPILSADGDVEGVFCACTETTGKIVAARRLETLHTIGARALGARNVADACVAAAVALVGNTFDLPFAAIYLLDDERRAAVRVAGTGLDASPLPELVHPDGPSWLDRAMHDALSGAPTEVVDVPPDERLRGGPWDDEIKQAVVVPITGASNAPVALLVAGVSTRRPLDSDYAHFYGLLAGHVSKAIVDGQAYDVERRRAETLAEIDQAKTVFFSNISHEFRTPLTLLLGPLERVLGGLAMDDALREPLDVAHRNALRLLRLVNTLMDFSRVEAGRMQARFEAVDLPALTVDLASTFRSACEAAGLTLSIDAPPLPEPVFVDRGMWETIVLNLLSNAFKFTWKGGIRVSLRQTADAAVVDVADTGIGIDERDQPRLFERFHRIEGAGGRTHEGSGIGLALVRELVRLHGGEVRVHSRPGLGTTFTVRLPLGSAHLPIDQIALVPTPERGGTAARAYVDEARRWLAAGDGPSRTSERIAGASVPGLVLVVDDNADMRDYVRELLIPRYDVAVAGNGAEALEAIARRRPDLVLSDVMMPGLDGFGLLKALRADPATAAIPVVLLSARAGHEATVEGLDAGADDYLVKPFTARELLARVSTHLETARLRRESADRQALLVAELQHRTRNLLGIVNAIVQQAMDRSADLPDFSRRFADRIDALARVQTLLSQSDQADAVAFDELIQSEVAALAGYADRVTLEGPTHVRLSPSIVQILALALHELATNAVKYGAFAHPDGHLTIRWHVDDDDGRTWLRMAWIERVPVGALPAVSAHGTGQGRMLIEQALPYQLGATTDFRLTPDGLLCTIALPLMSRGKLAG